MLFTFSAGADVHPIFWSLLTAERNEVSFFVLVGLAIIAIVWIAAGLWMIRSGEHRPRVR
jgi:hypothetical protein